MARKPPKKTPQSSSRRRSSFASPSASVTSTPRRAFPLNLLLRALSTPPRPPSHHPFLRAFSTPVRRRSEYSPLVRRLCQQGAYERLPYDNDLYARKILPCEGCREVGVLTQNIVFKQGHAGEWVRACRNPDCGLITYPAQPGTPPDLLQKIEAAREGEALSSTITSPESQTSGSSTFSSSRNRPRDLTPSIGGEFEDWFTPLFQELDMELASHPLSHSVSRSPERVAGPSSGAGLNPLPDTPPHCARDEEIARNLQAALDEEDAIHLQQLELPPPERPPQGNEVQGSSRLPSLTAELAAITSVQAEARTSPAAARPFTHEADAPSPSRCSSPESSPSPRPRKKKKRLLVHPPSPLPLKPKIRGPIPPLVNAKTRLTAPSGKTTVPKSRTATRPAKRQSEKPVKPSSKASGAPAALQQDKPQPSEVIVISSDDEDASARNLPQPRMLPTRFKEIADDSSVIDITSSDSDSDSVPPVTHLRSRAVERSRAPSRDVQGPACRTRGGLQTDGLPPVTQPCSRIVNESSAPSCHIQGSARDVQVAQRSMHGNPESDATPPAPQPHIPRRRVAHRMHAPSRNVQARARPPHADIEVNGPPPTTQLHSRAMARSYASSRDVQGSARRTRGDLQADSPPPATQPRSQVVDSPRDLQANTPLLPAVANVPDATRAMVETSASNKENEVSDVVHSSLDFSVSARLSARQASARCHVGVFASLAQTSSSSVSTHEEDDEELTSVPAGSPRPDGQSRPESANEVVNATEVFGDPFRFELWPAVPELAHNADPDIEARRWILTVKVWYKNNMPPSTKMIALEHAQCSIRLSEVFIVARAFQFAGIDHFRIWNQRTTDWTACSLQDYLPVSITDNHTLLIRFPTVATLTSWAETVSQAYGLCQTVDPRPLPSRKGKELAYD